MRLMTGRINELRVLSDESTVRLMSGIRRMIHHIRRNFRVCVQPKLHLQSCSNHRNRNFPLTNNSRQRFRMND